MCRSVFPRPEDVDLEVGKSVLLPKSNRRAELEVLGERNVSLTESRQEARQEVTGAAIEVLLLPEMSRDA